MPLPLFFLSRKNASKIYQVVTWTPHCAKYLDDFKCVFLEIFTQTKFRFLSQGYPKGLFIMTRHPAFQGKIVRKRERRKFPKISKKKVVKSSFFDVFKIWLAKKNTNRFSLGTGQKIPCHLILLLSCSISEIFPFCGKFLYILVFCEVVDFHRFPLQLCEKNKI